MEIGLRHRIPTSCSPATPHGQPGKATAPATLQQAGELRRASDFSAGKSRSVWLPSACPQIGDRQQTLPAGRFRGMRIAQRFRDWAVTSACLAVRNYAHLIYLSTPVKPRLERFRSQIPPSASSTQPSPGPLTQADACSPYTLLAHTLLYASRPGPGATFAPFFLAHIPSRAPDCRFRHAAGARNLLSGRVRPPRQSAAISRRRGLLAPSLRAMRQRKSAFLP